MEKASAVSEQAEPRVAAEPRVVTADRLLRALAELRGEVGAEHADSSRSPSPLAAVSPSPRCSSAADEQLVTEIRRALAGLAESRLARPDEVPAPLRRTLDGIDFVIRGDVLSGRLSCLSERLPSFVFLVLLPVAGKPEALRFAQRAGSLIDQPA